MKRGIALLLVCFLAIPLSGCNLFRWLGRHCRQVQVGLDGRKINASVTCQFGSEKTGPLEEAITKVVSVVDEATARGAVLSGFDECRDLCVNPDSDACDQCRSHVGAAITQPYFNICQGQVYQPLPNQLNVTVTAYTDLGPQVSPIVPATKERGTVRYNNCGGENADFVLPEAPMQSWGHGLINQGVRSVTRLEVTPVGGGADVPLIRVKEEFKNLVESGGIQDPLMVGVGVAGYLFNNGRDGDGDLINADGMSTRSVMLPQPPVGFGYGPTFSGTGLIGLKPCNSDRDCVGNTYCAGDLMCRAR